MIKKSLVLLTAVIMGATSLTNAADITITNKDKNRTSGPIGAAVYVKVGTTVKKINKGGFAKFNLPTSGSFFSITASRTGNVQSNKLTGNVYNTKLTLSAVKSKRKVQIDVTNKKVTASK